MRVGWRQLRPPYAGFDLWWYWHLPRSDPRGRQPLVHWLAGGRHLGLCLRPEVRPFRVLESPPTLCDASAFRGFDADGLVDDTVVAYVRDLSRFAESSPC